MKTNKHSIVTSVQQTQLLLPSAFQTSQTLPVSLVFPPVYLAKQTQIDAPKPTKKPSKQVKETVEPYVQICLQLFNKQNQLIQHSNIADFNTYLHSNALIKEIHIHTVQISKTGKLQSGKHNTVIDSGKNIGKTSETTIFQQAIQEITKKYLLHINKKTETYPHFMLLDLYKYQRSEQTSISAEPLLLSVISQDQQIVQPIVSTQKPPLQDEISQQDPLKGQTKLGLKLHEMASLMFPQFIQRKYDGLRCGAFSNTDINQLEQQGKQFTQSDITLLSRGHKEFNTLDAISLNISKLFNLLLTPSYISKQQQIFTMTLNSNIEQNNTNDTNILIDQFNATLPRNMLLDGELYIHDKSLQTLNSIIRNGSQPKDKDAICFVIYDIDITLNNRSLQVQLPFSTRKQLTDLIHSAIQELNISNIVVAPTYIAKSQQELNVMFQDFIKDKYEGAVIRDPNSLYCYSLNNKRSKDSLKYKLKLDMEVCICNFLDGQGKDTGSVIYECKVDNSHPESFQVVQNTTYDNRKKMFELLQNKPQYLDILKQIPFNIEYAVLSQSGIPQQPRGIYFRTEQVDINIPEDLAFLL